MPHSPYIDRCPLCDNQDFEHIYLWENGMTDNINWTRKKGFFVRRRFPIKAYRCTACYFIAHFAIE